MAKFEVENEGLRAVRIKASEPNLLDQSFDLNNDAPQYIWKGKKIEVSLDQESKVKVEYLEHCRLEALKKQKSGRSLSYFNIAIL